MQDAGYKTAVIGKWHLGLGDPAPDWNGEIKPGPLEIGFDTCFLLPTTSDRVPQVYVKDHRVLNLEPADPLWVGDKSPGPDHPNGITNRSELKMDWTHGHNNTIHNGISCIGFYTGGMSARFRDEELADKWVEQTNAYIAENKDKPFFLFFAAHDIHVPRIPHERFQEKSGTGLRGDSILQLDWCVGEITKTLAKHGLTENTLIVFCSENGPVLDDGYVDGSVTELGGHQPAGILTGGKYTVFEGGTRTPFITSWPGRIPAGESSEVVCTIDLASSFASLTGVKIPDGQCRDSLDILPALLGEKDAKGRAELLQQDNGSKRAKGDFGLRIGDWKLIRHINQYNGEATISKKPIPKLDGLHSLHFLPDHPSETKDLSAEKPERLKEMITRLDEIIAAEGTR